jgi:nucleoside-diphosphate-sugar epimerase
MKILVTGANGFIGGAVCRKLAADGHHVVAAMRERVELPPPIETRIVGSLGAETAWTAALTGIDAIVHLAGRAHIMRDHVADPEAAFRAINIEATLRLAREAARLGVRHFVFMSSVKVNGEATAGRPFAADDTPNPADAYARSKWVAEQGLSQLARADNGRFRVTVLRPPLVYGPGVRANFLTLLRAVAAGWPLPLGAVDNRRSLIFVDNLADAVAVALREPAGPFETFLPSDGEDISTPELIRRIALAMNRPARLFPLPPALLAGLGRLAGRAGAVERLTGSLQVDGGAFRQRFGWTPPTTLDQGLAATVAWFTGRKEI